MPWTGAAASHGYCPRVSATAPSPLGTIGPVNTKETGEPSNSWKPPNSAPGVHRPTKFNPALRLRPAGNPRPSGSGAASLFTTRQALAKLPSRNWRTVFRRSSAMSPSGTVGNAGKLSTNRHSRPFSCSLNQSETEAASAPARKTASTGRSTISLSLVSVPSLISGNAAVAVPLKIMASLVWTLVADEISIDPPAGNTGSSAGKTGETAAVNVSRTLPGPSSTVMPFSASLTSWSVIRWGSSPRAKRELGIELGGLVFGVKPVHRGDNGLDYAIVRHRL